MPYRRRLTLRGRLGAAANRRERRGSGGRAEVRERKRVVPLRAGRTAAEHTQHTNGARPNGGRNKEKRRPPSPPRRCEGSPGTDIVLKACGSWGRRRLSARGHAPSKRVRVRSTFALFPPVQGDSPPPTRQRKATLLGPPFAACTLRPPFLLGPRQSRLRQTTACSRAQRSEKRFAGEGGKAGRLRAPRRGRESRRLACEEAMATTTCND